MCQRHIFVLTFCLLTQYLILICKNINSCIKYKIYKGWIKYFVIVIVIVIVYVYVYVIHSHDSSHLLVSMCVCVCQQGRKCQQIRFVCCIHANHAQLLESASSPMKGKGCQQMVLLYYIQLITNCPMVPHKWSVPLLCVKTVKLKSGGQ